MSLLDVTPPITVSERPTQFQTLTVVSFVLTGLTLLWAGVDTRLIDGAPVWMKPLKFAVSFAVLFATIALVELRLSDRVRTGWSLRIVGWVMAAAFLAEMAYIIYQGARAEASHYNLSTPFNEFMYMVVMAAGAVALVACIGVIGWLVKRDVAARLSPALREAIWFGFAISFVLTLIVASYISSGTSHFVGVHPEGAPVLPILGWSGVTGDLRPAHFLSLHAMQVLPLLAVWLDRRSHHGSLRTIRWAAAVYVLATVAVFAQAILGLPLIPLA